MSQHDSNPGSATGSTRPRSVPPGSDAPSGRTSRPVPGVEPISLRAAVDVRTAEARLTALGQSRSTSALGERADLLRTLGRLDEALAIAEEAFRLAHFTGDRADSTAARIRRAHVLREQGKLERALGDLHTSRITASTEEWRVLEATAAELEGYTLFDLGRYDESDEVLTAALTAYEQAGAARDRLDALRTVIEGLMRAAHEGPAHARETGSITPIGRAAAGAHAAVASPPEEGDTNPSGLPRVGDGSPTSAAVGHGDQGEGGAQQSPEHADVPAPASAAPAPTSPATPESGATATSASEAPALQAPAPIEPALAAAMRIDPGDAPAASSAPAAPSEPVLDKPSTRADTSLWGKISSLAANAAGHRDRDGERAVVVDAPAVDDDGEPRRGATGVTGVVDGLPRDDEPTTWPFPAR
ncbi:tetratricopeptide repeat protein [Frigoribacterium sp. CFBP 8766]|uniref:tetratricopeptide repeat protein n=1 Tax=Frigoribacterium sp. CFBP 8766 TaxID=2775273 RepID=UPI001781B65E|nr:tetratricopeptide repeat protein [Frigoribacterium sp. CFBP 8766]MBD8583186.1 tetratricopeptide repeat protein [Frigoribacterium sp. CFBP 8766]